MLRWLIILAAMVIVQPVRAWEFTAEEDPLTDVPTGIVVADSGQGFGIGIKCWRGGETQLRVLTQLPYGTGEALRKTVRVDFRVDKKAVVSAVMITAELDGRVSLVTASESADFEFSDAHAVLKDLSAAESRLVVGLLSQVAEIRAKGAAKAIKLLAERCGLLLK